MPIPEVIHPLGLDIATESQIMSLGLRQSFVGSEALRKQGKEYRQSISFLKRGLRDGGFDLEFLQTQFPRPMWEVEKSNSWPEVPLERSDGLVIPRNVSRGRKSWLEALCLAIDRFRGVGEQEQFWGLLLNSFGLHLSKSKEDNLEAVVAGTKLLFEREPLTKDLAAIALVPKGLLERILKERVSVVLSYPFILAESEDNQVDAHLHLTRGEGRTLKVEDISHLPYHLKQEKTNPEAFFFRLSLGKHLC